MATVPGFQKIPNMYAECDFGRVKLIRDDDDVHERFREDQTSGKWSKSPDGRTS